MDNKDMDWLRSKSNTLKFHFSHMELDASKYIQTKRIELGQQVLALHRIYLDTKQWIQMRDAAIGRPRNEIQSNIFDHLKSLRKSGTIICPVSYSVFVELMNQSDEQTRLATARVIDELAGGCCILPPHVLTEREILYFLLQHGVNGRIQIAPTPAVVWTKIPFVFGEFVPQSSALKPEVMGAIRRSMDDLLCDLTVEEFVSQLGTRTWGIKAVESNFLAEISQGKRDHANDHSSFHQLLCSEVAGILDAHRNMLEHVMIFCAEMNGVTAGVSDAERESGGKMLADLIYSAFKHKKVKDQLPQIHIGASLHAALRWDKNRKYEFNDFEDIRHASVALPYFDVFCTERGLCHQIRQKLLKLDEVYSTKVISGDDEFLAHLDLLMGA